MCPPDIVHTLVGSISALLVCVSLTYMLGFRSRKMRVYYVVSYILLGLLAEFVLDDFLHLHTLNGLVQIVLVFVATLVFSNDGFLRVILAVSVIMVTLLLSEPIGMAILKLGGGAYDHNGSINIFLSPVLYCFCVLTADLVSASLMLLAVAAWNRIIRKSEESALLLFALFPVSQVLTLWFVTILLAQLNANPTQILVLTVGGFTNLAADIVMLFALKKLAQDMDASKKEAFLRIQLERQQEYYDHIKQRSASAAKLKHDMRNQLNTAYSMLACGNREAAKKQLGALSDALSKEDTYLPADAETVLSSSTIGCAPPSIHPDHAQEVCVIKAEPRK